MVPRADDRRNGFEGALKIRGRLHRTLRGALHLNAKVNVASFPGDSEHHAFFTQRPS